MLLSLLTLMTVLVTRKWGELVMSPRGGHGANGMGGRYRWELGLLELGTTGCGLGLLELGMMGHGLRLPSHGMMGKRIGLMIGQALLGGSFGCLPLTGLKYWVKTALEMIPSTASQAMIGSIWEQTRAVTSHAFTSSTSLMWACTLSRWAACSLCKAARVFQRLLPSCLSAMRHG